MTNFVQHSFWHIVSTQLIWQNQNAMLHRQLFSATVIHCCPVCRKDVPDENDFYLYKGGFNTKSSVSSFVLYCFVSKLQGTEAYSVNCMLRSITETASVIGIFARIQRQMIPAMSQPGTKEVKGHHGCSSSCSSCPRIRHPSLPALYSSYSTMLEPQFLSLCLMPSLQLLCHCLLPPLLLSCTPYQFVPASGCFCYPASASTEISLETTCLCTKVTLCEAPRPSHHVGC